MEAGACESASRTSAWGSGRARTLRPAALESARDVAGPHTRRHACRLQSNPVSRLYYPNTPRVAVITRTADVWHMLEAWLANQTTIVEHFSTLDDLITSARPDVLVCDREAFEEFARILCRLRSRWPTSEIIVIRARDRADIAQLLDIGADAAVTADTTVMAARLRALVRRARTVNADFSASFGDIVFARDARRIWCSGREIALTPTEQALLDCLFRYAPQPVAVQTLTEHVWGDSRSCDRLALVRVYMGYLRRKLERSERVLIKTVRGVGYQLTSR